MRSLDSFDEVIPISGTIVMRRWRSDDAPSLAEACDDPEIARWLAVPSPYTADHARAYLASVDSGWQLGTTYAFALSSEGLIVGSIAIRPHQPQPSIGYWLAASARGRGVATKAVEAIVVWAAATFSLIQVWIFAQPDNLASCGVAKRAGFVEQPERMYFLDGKMRVVFRRTMR